MGLPVLVRCGCGVMIVAIVLDGVWSLPAPHTHHERPMEETPGWNIAAAGESTTSAIATPIFGNWVSLVKGNDS